VPGASCGSTRILRRYSYGWDFKAWEKVISADLRPWIWYCEVPSTVEGMEKPWRRWGLRFHRPEETSPVMVLMRVNAPWDEE